MRKAYSVIVTLIVLGLLGYILAVPRAMPDQKASPSARVIQATDAPPLKTYVLNTNTKKFHKPSCSSVKQMKEKNKRTVTSTRQAIMEQGYAPCQRCKP